jgi:hypothetical protein
MFTQYDLLEQANKYFELRTAMKSSGLSIFKEVKSLTQVFLIDKHWLQKWKDYVRYSDYKRKKKYAYYYKKYKSEPEYSSEEIETKHPGKIINNRLICDFSEFHNDGDINNPDNYIINFEVDKSNDIKLLSRELWDFFYNLYSGGPMLEIKIVSEKNNITGTTKRIIELFLKSFNLVFIPRLTDLNEDSVNKMKIKPFYYSRAWDYKAFKSKVARACYNSENVDNLRLWKISSKYVLPLLKSFLLEYIKDKKIEFDNITYLECKNYII